MVKLGSSILKDRFRTFLKFGTVGVISVSLSLTLNFVFLKFFETPLIPTYISVYLFTLALSYFLNSKFTYRVSLSKKKCYCISPYTVHQWGLGWYC